MSDIDSGAQLPDASDGGQGRAADLKRRAQEALNQGVDTARFQAMQARDYAGQQFGQAQTYVSDRIVERPLTSALTALGAGVVLGLLLSGRRRGD
jgi:ElaB/YqjD/DUF883 family membrane-anchored ribosome-binding protein